MKKRRKRHIVFLFALAWAFMFTAYGQTEAAAGPSAEESPDAYTETGVTAEPQGDTMPVQEKKTSEEENLADIICRIQKCNLVMKKKYKEYMRIFSPDDFTSQEIACANLFSSCQDGRENREIQALYDAAGEQWEYLWYVEYDYDRDGRQDYIVLHDCPDRKEGVDIGGGDVWIEKDFRQRVKLPETTYLIGGTWEEPQLYMMLLTHTYDDVTMPSFAVFQDYAGQEMALYGSYGSYKRVKATTVVEELDGVRITQTDFSLPYSDGYDPVRLQIRWDKGEQQEYQVIMINRRLSPLKTGHHNCVAWDGNDDGYEDILYYIGYGGGSGGSWDYYYLLCWSEERQEYIEKELPGCVFINYEEHKLYSRGQSGACNPFYQIFGLQDGEYRLEKELDLSYGVWRDDKTVDVATDFEYGEIVEEIDITGLSQEEERSILEEKYPEFTFWREG